MSDHANPPSGDAVPVGLPRDPSQSYHPGKPPATEVPLPAEDTHPPRWVATTEVDYSNWSASRSSAAAAGAPNFFPLCRVVGRGGVGEVWEAIQPNLGRTIAIKRLREDLHSSSVDNQERSATLEYIFRQEALTTGNLEHPNIVPIYDLGVDEAGRPLLAMKLVRGDPWDSMIEADRTRLTVSEFLARHLPILVAVGNAVSYAHSRGIVHRDIKPSQVMVGEFGEVLLMDWGLALGVGDAATAPASVGTRSPIASTRANATNPSGTPAFMAPEQTERTANRIGTWTDVYLLGGTLYFLLTHRPPHDAQTSSGAFLQARRTAVPPPEVVAQDREVPLELSQLAMQALCFAPEDRVPSARVFVQGVEDYLTGASRRRESAHLVEQVSAAVGDDGDYRELAQRLNQLERAAALWPDNPSVPALRHRVLSAYVVAAIRNGDLVLARVQAERLDRGPDQEGFLRAVGRLEEEKRRAEERLAIAYKKVQVQRDRAEDLMRFLMQELHEGLRKTGHLDLLDKVAQKSRQYYESIPEEDATNETLHRRALALDRIGDVLRDQENLEGALRAYEDFRGLADRLVQRDPDNLAWQSSLADSLGKIGRIRYEQRDLAGALADFHACRGIREMLASREPDNRTWQSNLAHVHSSIGTVSWRRGLSREALESHERSLAIRERLVADDPGNPAWREDLAWVHNCIAVVHEGMGEFDKAREFFLKGLEIRRQLVREEPGHIPRERAVAWCYGSLGQLAGAHGDLEEAVRSYRASLEILESHARKDPTNDRLQRDIAWGLGSMSGVLNRLNKPEEATEALVRGISIQERLVAKDSSNVSLHAELAWSLGELGVARELLGDSPGALEAFEKSVKSRELAHRREPDNPRTIAEFAAAFNSLAGARTRQGDAAGARDAWRRAIEVTEATPGLLEKPHILAPWAVAQFRLGNLDAARPALQKLAEKGYKDAEVEKCRAN